MFKVFKSSISTIPLRQIGYKAVNDVYGTFKG